ncbi:hypothetical protein BDV96DRAFT_639749 [Lophiotrema nucula]|uniref:Uncharacterized protein n=1 Tax=Lophiotrema nucula TaxID=690887 RepID=A0A6A5ZUN3_9PLEO|nr:hypothetical protein BDV96DRAFT_639749 [Lophiotrema nucula]
MLFKSVLLAALFGTGFVLAIPVQSDRTEAEARDVTVHHHQLDAPDERVVWRYGAANKAPVEPAPTSEALPMPSA